MKKKLAIVGYGGQGAWHASWAQKSDCIELAGIYDIAEKRTNAAKENGIHTCIETNASLPYCEEIFETVDYMIADFKSPFEEKVKSILGGDVSTIKKNLLHRAKTGKPLLVRIPLIHFFNCGEDNARGFAEFFNELKATDNPDLYFEILTYHEFGKDKYERLSMEYSVSDGFVTQEDVDILLNILKDNNLKVINT